MSRPPERGRGPPGNRKRRPGQVAPNLESNRNSPPSKPSRADTQQRRSRPSQAAIRAGIALLAPRWSR
jgi:hypothetical protein